MRGAADSIQLSELLENNRPPTKDGSVQRKTANTTKRHVPLHCWNFKLVLRVVSIL